VPPRATSKLPSLDRAAAVTDVGGREHMALLAALGVVGSSRMGHHLVGGSLCAAALLLTVKGHQSVEGRYHASL
jgi:hypothetical protein